LRIAADYGFFDDAGELVTLQGTTLTRTNLSSGDSSTLEPVLFDAFPIVSPDGSRIVFGATRGKATILDSHTRRRIGDFDIPPAWPNATSFAFSPDGRKLLVAQTDESGTGGTLYTVTLDSGKWIEAACTAAGRSLTVQEWRELTSQDPPASLACSR
jgi:Tol biopolymer transport system component